MPTILAPRGWLLLRGLLREVGHWGTFVDQWRGRFPGEAVVALDLPGCGSLAGRPAPALVADLLACVRGSLAEAVASAGPLGLVGLSLGGMVVSEWRRRYPGEVAGAVIISSSAGDLCRPWQRLRPAGAWHLLRAALARSLETREGHIFRATSALADRRDETVARWVQLARAQPVTRANAARLLMAGNRFRLGPPPAGPPAPALVLAGQGDRLVHPRCSRALAEALGAELQVHPRAGHDLPLDDPAWVLERVASWRRRVLNGPAPGAVRDA